VITQTVQNGQQIAFANLMKFQATCSGFQANKIALGRGTQNSELKTQNL
jgi:hypothetical protein